MSFTTESSSSRQRTLRRFSNNNGNSRNSNGNNNVMWSFLSGASSDVGHCEPQSGLVVGILGQEAGRSDPPPVNRQEKGVGSENRYAGTFENQDSIDLRIDQDRRREDGWPGKLRSWHVTVGEVPTADYPETGGQTSHDQVADPVSVSLCLYFCIFVNACSLFVFLVKVLVSLGFDVPMVVASANMHAHCLPLWVLPPFLCHCPFFDLRERRIRRLNFCRTQISCSFLTAFSTCVIQILTFRHVPTKPSRPFLVPQHSSGHCSF